MKITSQIVEGFVGSVLAKHFDGAVKTPQFHKELWDLACSDNKFVAVSAPRGHAKSTAGTLAYGLASALFRESKFIVIVSDTEAQAVMFLQQYTNELQNNEDIIELFGIKKNEKGAVQFITDSQTDIIVECNDGHKFRVMAKGAEQKLRGLNWNGSRPDLLLIDDLENDELVLNRDRREKLKRWFRGALLPCLSPSGRIRMWGTILHMDSLLENLMPKIYGKWTVITPLKMYDNNPRKVVWRSVKYKAHNKDMTEFLWPERFSKEYFTTLFEEAKAAGMLDLYAQEQLNEPIDESAAYFKRNDFLPRSEEDKEKRLSLYITADLAISLAERADYSVFIVGGMDEDRILHIVDVIRARLDGKEIVETILNLEKIYKPEVFGVEEMQVSKAIGPFLREEMVKQNVYPNFVYLKHGGKDKTQRAKSIQARHRAKAIKFEKGADWYPIFEEELCKFPRDVHDDQVDSFAYLGMLLDKMIEAPTDEEIEEEEYLEELNDSGYNNQGRSRITGY